MKKVFVFCFGLILLSTLVLAIEGTCPADRASQQGFDPFGAFHEIMAPVWHQAWPNKDYDALLAAGPKFSEKFKKIAELTPVLKTEDRTKKFYELRKQFATLVEQYAAACKNGDKELAYQLMPALHDAFEITASSLLPVHYPELQGVVITLNLILETHIPTNNSEGIIGSTETLVTKVSALNEASIPEELKKQMADILKDFDAIKKTADTMKECCDKNDMEQYKEHAQSLSRILDQFHKKFI